jgi:hypothetical protein
MSTEVMKQALEALEIVAVDVNTTPNAYESIRQAITALRAAIEHYERDLIPQDKLLVAGQLGAHVTRVREERHWQGLTTDEVFECQEASYMDTYSNIEAKLKEKNT